MVLAMVVGAQAAVTIDFTTATTAGPFPGNDQSSYTYDDYDLFGDGSLTVDITVADTGGAQTLDQREQGWGLNGGSGRLDAGESLSFTVSDLQGTAASAVTGFEFVGFVAEYSNSAYTITSDDIISVNGVTLNGRDQTNSTGLVTSLAWQGNEAAQAGYDLEDGFSGDTSALTIGTSGTFTVTELANPSAETSWDSMRLAGFQIAVLSEANLPPVATAQEVITFPDTPKNITLSGIDPEGGSLTYSVATPPSHGTLATNGALPELIYTPANGYEGDDSFTFTVNDGVAVSAPATVSIAVTNQIPTAAAQSVTVEHNTAKAITLTGNDPDNGPGSLTYAVTTPPSNGTLDTGALPSVTYTPNSGFSGSDSFAYVVNDGLADSAPATVSITVEEAGQAIGVGTVIGIDFGNDAGQTANWNNIGTPADTTLGTIVDTNGVAVSGVSFTVDNVPANSGENDGASVTAGHPDIPGTAQDDDWFESNAGQWILSFSGLDSSLTYRLKIGCYWIGGTEAQQENRNTGWQLGTDESTQLNTIADSEFGSYVTFEDIAITNGTLEVRTWDYNGNTISSLSALTLSVVRGEVETPELAIEMISTNQVEISWNSSIGAVYSVQSRPNLVINDWTTIADGLAATPPVNAYTTTVNGATAEFFQVSGE